MKASDSDFRSNYTRALRSAASGGRRQLLAMLRSGVPLYPADMAMLADFIEGKFQPKGLKRGRTPFDVFMSRDPADQAVSAVWIARAAGSEEIEEQIAERFGVDLESMRRTLRRYAAKQRAGQKPPD